MLFCCLHMCVKLRARIKDDEVASCVQGMSLKYTSTQKWCQQCGIVLNSQQTVSTCFSEYQIELAMNRTG